MRDCTHCHASNHPQAKYCYLCGQALSRRSVQERLERLNFSALAGTGLRATNIFPLGTKDLLKSEQEVKQAPVRFRPDQSWFCPDCGTHNPAMKQVCKACGRTW
jgi:predicted amidophosphoribosyltransferase